MSIVFTREQQVRGRRQLVIEQANCPIVPRDRWTSHYNIRAQSITARTYFRSLWSEHSYDRRAQFLPIATEAFFFEVEAVVMKSAALFVLLHLCAHRLGQLKFTRPHLPTIKTNRAQIGPRALWRSCRGAQNHRDINYSRTLRAFILHLNRLRACAQLDP